MDDNAGGRKDSPGGSSLGDVRRMNIALLEWLHRVAAEPGSARAADTEPLKLSQALIVREVLSIDAIVREPLYSSSPDRERKRKASDVYPHGQDLLSSPEKDVGIGPSFQADVPEWTGPPSEEDTDTLKYLGTPVGDLAAADQGRRTRSSKTAHTLKW